MRHLPLVGAALAVLALPAAAVAHNATAVPACERASASATGFKLGQPNTMHYRITVDGAPFTTGTTTPFGAAAVLDLPYPTPLVGTGLVVRVYLSWQLPDHTRTEFLAGKATVTCQAPDVPPPTDTTPVPVPPPSNPDPLPAPPPPEVSTPGAPVGLPVGPREPEPGILSTSNEKPPVKATPKASSRRVYVGRCRVYGRTLPRNATPHANRVPRPGTFRVTRDWRGRWAGYRDRTVVTVNARGKRTVRFYAGEFCGVRHLTPAVAA